MSIIAPRPAHPKRPSSLLNKAKVLHKRVWPVFGISDWIPKHQVRSVAGDQFVATGPDPQLRLKYRLAAGWYMLEVRLMLPYVLAEAKIYTNTGAGDLEDDALTLRLRSDKLAKRLIFLAKPAKLRFDPMSAEGRFRVHHLKVVKVSQAFALKRLRKKLAVNHPLYAIHATPTSPQRKKKATETEISQLWTDYDKLFELRSVLSSYTDWIERVERTALAKQKNSAQEIAAWVWRPNFVVVILVDCASAATLRHSIDSIIAQSYPHWKLFIIVMNTAAATVQTVVDIYSARDARIKVCRSGAADQLADTVNTVILTISVSQSGVMTSTSLLIKPNMVPLACFAAKLLMME